MDTMRHPPSASGRRSRQVPRWLVLALALVIGLAIALGIDVARAGGPRAWLALHRLGSVWSLTYDARGDLHDVGGRRLYLDCRGEGSPTVVLVAGAGVDAATWAPVVDDIAATTRTCVYDRPGLGRSDPGRTADHAAAAADLRALLAAADEGGPFVLVGHSLGADMARVVASEDRARILGLGLIDGFEPDLFTERVVPLLGPLTAEYLAHQDRLWSAVTAAEGLDRRRSTAQLATADLRGLPIEVVRAARAEPRLDEAANRRIHEARMAGYESLSPGNVRYTDAFGSGHVVQADRPDLVIAAVERLIEWARSAP